MTRTIDERLELSMTDYFWAPEGVEVIEEDRLIYTRSRFDDPLFNQVVFSRFEGDERDLVDRISIEHRGRTCRWIVNDLNQSDALLDALRHHGYQPGDRHRAYAIATDAYRREPRRSFDVRRVLDAQTLRDLDHTRRLAFGRPGVLSAAQFKKDLAECQRPDARVARFVVYLDAKPVGSASLTRHDDLDLGFLWAGGIVEEYRGLGAYTALLKARCEWALEQGISQVGLYAKVDTSAPIVSAHGFQPHGSMQYWDRH